MIPSCRTPPAFSPKPNGGDVKRTILAIKLRSGQKSSEKCSWVESGVYLCLLDARRRVKKFGWVRYHNGTGRWCPCHGCESDGIQLNFKCGLTFESDIFNTSCNFPYSRAFDNIFLPSRLTHNSRGWDHHLRSDRVVFGTKTGGKESRYLDVASETWWKLGCGFAE